jgi:hypothetical protein
MLTSHPYRLFMVLTILGVITSLAPAVSLAEGFAGHVNFLVGLKALEEDDWLPLEKQIGAGIESTWGREGWPIWIAVDLYRSRDSETVLGSRVEAETREAGLGIRRVWNNDDAHVYLGVGVDYLSAEIEVDGESDDDHTLGGWVGGAAFWRVGARANVGVTLRYSNGRVTLFDDETKAGGIQSGILLGWGWPAYE